MDAESLMNIIAMIAIFGLAVTACAGGSAGMNLDMESSLSAEAAYDNADSDEQRSVSIEQALADLEA